MAMKSIQVDNCSFSSFNKSRKKLHNNKVLLLKRLEFFWSSSPMDDSAVLRRWWRTEDEASPDVLVLGNGLRTVAANMSKEEGLEHLAHNVHTNLIPVRPTILQV